MTSTHHHRVIIIGTGFAGIAAAVNLNKQGITDFIMLEREKQMGGTWWRNNYPGAAVDVESVLYSLSFAQKNWSRAFAKQQEILDYTNEVIDEYQLREKAVVNSNVSDLRFDETQSIWKLQTDDGREFSAKYVINAIGHLSQPVIPKIAGQDSFQGASFHTSRWDHEFDYRNKRVGVIGTGASALQVVPAIADDVQKLTVFQRTPHWIVPRHDKEYSENARRWFSIPWVSKLRRALSYWQHETRVVAFQYFPSLIKIFAQKKALKHLHSQVSSADLVKKLTPDYTIGCKRILISNDYYPTLQKDQVELETSGIAEINASGIKTQAGEQVDLDLLIYATGFHAFTSNECLPFDIIGREGTSLKAQWQAVAHAYAGVAVPKFPNLFNVNGPNTGIGHTSAIFMSESQVAYIVDAINYMEKHNKTTVEIKPEVEHTYNKNLRSKFKYSVWATGGCNSWYNSADGTNTTIYPTFTFIFNRITSRFKPKLHVIN